MKKFLKYSALALVVLWLVQQTGLDKTVEDLWYNAQKNGLIEKVVDGIEDLASILIISEESLPEQQS